MYLPPKDEHVSPSVVGGHISVALCVCLWKGHD